MDGMTMQVSMELTAECVQRAIARHVAAETGAPVSESDVVIASCARIELKLTGEMLVGMFKGRPLDPAPQPQPSVFPTMPQDGDRQAEDATATLDAVDAFAERMMLRVLDAPLTEAVASLEEQGMRVEVRDQRAEADAQGVLVVGPEPDMAALVARVLAGEIAKDVADETGVRVQTLAVAAHHAKKRAEAQQQQEPEPEAPGPKAESDWSLADDEKMIRMSYAGKSDGKIAADLGRRPPEIRARRQELIVDSGIDDLGDLARMLMAEIERERAA